MFNRKNYDNSSTPQQPAPAATQDNVLVSLDAPELSDLWQPEATPTPEKKLGVEDRLIDHGTITPDQVNKARSIHEQTPRKRIGQVLVDMGAITETELLICIAEQYNLPFLNLTPDMIDMQVFKLLDPAFIQNHNILPLDCKDGKLKIATPDPANVFLLDEVRRKVNMPLLIHVSLACEIQNILETILKDANPNYDIEDIIEDMEDGDLEVVATREEEIADVERAAAGSPVIKLVNYLFLNAVKEGASDIHIEPGDKQLKVRYRIDGVLFEALAPPHTMHAAVVSRIKIMANLDIAERRLPQDGRIRVMIHGRKVDMRVSTVPCSYGEKVVIRILDTRSTQQSLANLGIDPDILEILDEQIKQPHGMILVTGPTGSGKSTTLYASLRSMDTLSLNVSTVEDPVEFQLEQVTQIQVQEHIGMTFSAALRSLLRQDPDVIMVGEIRDGETARIAVQASLTGHLVLSTLHTNDAPSSVTRLINIGIEPYLIASSTNAILAQRLVRKICSNCKEPAKISPNEDTIDPAALEAIGLEMKDTFQGKGCDHCRNTGYQGRVGLYELMLIDDEYRNIITGNPTATELRQLCKKRGMVTLRQAGLRKVKQGLTTFQEILRVTENHA